MFQVTCNPVPKSDTPSTSAQEVQRSLKRTARMTPLWRIMGTKPHGAYCQNNYECSTAICRWMHFVIKYFCPAINTFNHICWTRNVRTDPQFNFVPQKRPLFLQPTDEFLKWRLLPSLVWRFHTIMHDESLIQWATGGNRMCNAVNHLLDV